MKRYRLRHRISGESLVIEAPTAQEACRKAGWLIGQVWVREQSFGPHATGWRNVTEGR